MAHLGNEDLCEFQRLHSMFREKCKEEIQLLEEITKTKLDMQQLRLRLGACGIQDTSLIPKDLRCGGNTENTATLEMQSFINWLAESCEFKDPVIFDVGSAVRVGSRDAFMGRMVSWPLSEQGGLKLNVPQALESDIKVLLQRARRSPLAGQELQHFSESWEMIGAEVAGEGSTRPAIFLIHRQSEETVVVAAWPSVQPVVKPVFDPDEYFKSLSDKATENALPRETSAATGPRRTVLPSDCDESSVSPLLPTSKGDRVELRSDQEGRPITKSRSAGHLHQ